MPDAADDVGGFQKRSGDIGQRPQQAKRHRARRFTAQGFDDEIHRMLGFQPHFRIRKCRAIQTGLAMHMLGGDQFAVQRRGTAGKHPGSRFARQLADHPRVLFGQMQRHVARNRGDPQHLDIFG